MMSSMVRRQREFSGRNWSQSRSQKAVRFQRTRYHLVIRCRDNIPPCRPFQAMGKEGVKGDEQYATDPEDGCIIYCEQLH